LKNHGSEYHAFAIFTMCRALHALEHGIVVSKPTAARWAQNELGDRWRQVIERAVAQQAGHEDRDLYHDSLEFIRFTQNIVRNLRNK
jgi:hypothetical protein